MHKYLVQIASRFIQQFKEPDSASHNPVVITSAYIPEKICKNKKKKLYKNFNYLNFRFFLVNFLNRVS